MVKYLPAVLGTWVWPGLERSPGEGNGQPTPVFLPVKSHKQRTLVGYPLCLWGRRWLNTHLNNYCVLFTHPKTNLILSSLIFWDSHTNMVLKKRAKQKVLVIGSLVQILEDLRQVIPGRQNSSSRGVGCEASVMYVSKYM